MFNPIINEVKVVAIFDPKTMPNPDSKVNKLAFISVIVNMINALLDWIKEVKINPVSIDLFVDEVKDNNLSLTFVFEIESKSLLNKSIEYIKSIIPPISNVRFIFFTS